MTNKELTNEIYKRMVEIQEMYSKAYPKGNYLSMCIMNGNFMFNNQYSDEDKDYPIVFWKDASEGEEEC